jgi:hypothetical protein
MNVPTAETTFVLVLRASTRYYGWFLEMTIYELSFVNGTVSVVVYKDLGRKFDC